MSWHVCKAKPWHEPLLVAAKGVLEELEAPKTAPLDLLKLEEERSPMGNQRHPTMSCQDPSLQAEGRRGDKR